MTLSGVCKRECTEFAFELDALRTNDDDYSSSRPAPLRTISAPYFFRTFSSIASRAASFFLPEGLLLPLRFQRTPVVEEIQLAVLAVIQTGCGDADQTDPDAFGEEPVGTCQKVTGAPSRPVLCVTSRNASSMESCSRYGETSLSIAIRRRETSR